jgi:hypothetical protein
LPHCTQRCIFKGPAACEYVLQVNPSNPPKEFIVSALPISNPKQIAERGEAIYAAHFREEYERNHPGQFVAIDIQTEQAYLAGTPEDALETARKAAPHGIFHLIQVGQAGAFRVSYSQSTALDWIFQ